MYCERCNRVFSGADCPHCGSSDGRDPTNGDLCFLIEKESMWAQMLENVLMDNSIPYITKKRMGIGMALKVGPSLEQVSFYVPYEYLSAATDITTVLFSNEEEGEYYED